MKRSSSIQRLLFASISFLAVQSCFGQSSTSPSSSVNQGAKTTTIGGMTFTVADGLRFERVVEESLIQWPIAATFHPDGDLLVLECHWPLEPRQPVKKQLETRPHKIVRLTDTNGDRHYDKRTVIAEDLGFPEGIMVFGKDLLVTAPPEILRLSDQDGDGIFETRSVWFDGTTLTNCANDLHGPMMGPDGWIYWTKGAFAEQNPVLIQRSDKPDESHPGSKAAHIYRRHPNGGPIERLMTGGMDNPSDLAFSPEGEIFFCSTFLHHPGNGLRDGIAHSPRGGLFGKQHQVLDGHWTTGPLLQPMTNLGPAAPASVNYLASNVIPASTKAFQSFADIGPLENRFLVSSQFNLQRIGLHRLVPSGATFKTEEFDLVTADKIDFHPTDTLEESDGSLLVFDTGGWYDLCCPSSGKDKDIARGGIYRLSPVQNVANFKPIRKLTTAQSVEVATRVGASSLDRKRAIWTIATEITHSRDLARNKPIILALLRDSDPTVQQTACHVVGLNRWMDAKNDVQSLLESESPATVRVALETLGVIGDARSIPFVLKALERFPTDRYIIHSSIFALMEIGNVEAMVQCSREFKSEIARYAAIYALDQIKKLPDELLPVLVGTLASTHADLRDLSVRCLSRRSQGIALCIPHLKQAWQSSDFDALNAAIPVVQAGGTNVEIQSLFEGWLSNASIASPQHRQWLITCLKRVGAESLPSSWIPPIAGWVQRASPDEELVSLADSIQGGRIAIEARENLARTLSEKANSLIDHPKTAIQLLAACPMTSLQHKPACSELILKELVAVDAPERLRAEQALSRSNLSVESAQKLIALLDQISPVQLQSAIEAVLRCNDDKLDIQLVERMAQIPGTRTLSLDRSLASVSKRSDAFKQKWATTIQMATKPPEDIEKNIQAWLSKLPTGDPSKGYHVFRSAKTACSACHQVGYIGGRLGPELSKIGKSRTRRDLVEAILFPSVRIEQGYAPTRIRTTDDEVVNGLVSKQTESYIELVCGVDKICRVSKSEIAEQRDSSLSVMPTGLENQMTLAEFADLIAFLESKK